MPSKYTFSDYNSRWPEEFALEAERIRAILGDALIDVHHIGSTSVPGLAAKPVIDLIPVVKSIQQIDDLTPAMSAAGYKAWGDYGIPGRRLFTKDDRELRTHNLHCFAQDDLEIERHLAFCAYLRAHQKVCDEYAALKREVYARHPGIIVESGSTA